MQITGANGRWHEKIRNVLFFLLWISKGINLGNSREKDCMISLIFFYQLGQIFILILLEMAVSDPITPELLPDLIIQK